MLARLVVSFAISFSFIAGPVLGQESYENGEFFNFVDLNNGKWRDIQDMPVTEIEEFWRDLSAQHWLIPSISRAKIRLQGSDPSFGGNNLLTTDSFINWQWSFGERFRLNLTTGLDTIFREDGEKQSASIDHDDFIQAFNLQWWFATLDGQPVVIAVGEQPIPVGAEIRKLGNYLASPLRGEGLTRVEDVWGFVIPIPMHLFDKPAWLKLSAYNSEKAEAFDPDFDIDSFAAEFSVDLSNVVNFVNGQIKAILAYNHMGNQSNPDLPHSDLANAGLLWQSETGQFSAWYKLHYLEEGNVFPTAGWGQVVGGSAWVWDRSFELVAELTRVEDTIDAVGLGINYPIHTPYMNVIVSYTLTFLSPVGPFPSADVHAITLEFLPITTAQEELNIMMRDREMANMHWNKWKRFVDERKETQPTPPTPSTPPQGKNY